LLQRLESRQVQNEIADGAGTNNKDLQAQTAKGMKSTIGAALDEYGLDFGIIQLIQCCTVSGGI
jgi:hemolysin activation/secretion protein